MRKKTLAILALGAVLMGAALGCQRATGGAEARYLALFSKVWQRCHSLGLYEVTVESVTPLPDGHKRVVVNYLYDNGMVPDQGQAAMLVSPENRLADPCVVDLEIDQCLGGGAPIWHAKP